MACTFPYRLLAIIAVGSLVASCAASESHDGHLAVAVSSATALDNVSELRIAIDGDDMEEPVYALLTLHGNTWGGILAGIPAGCDRTLIAEAYDSSGIPLYSGNVSDLQVSTGDSGFVYLGLAKAKPPQENNPPVIKSLTASDLMTQPGKQVDLTVKATDKDKFDVLTYLWTATDGSFDDPLSTNPVWTAPNFASVATISITVTDSQGASQSLSLNIEVTFGSALGSADVQVAVNTWPIVTDLLASSSRLDGGETTTLMLAASDPDGDPLTFVWSDSGGDCAGQFSDVALQNPTWTAPLLPPAAEKCTLTALASDGRGGNNTGALTLQVASAPEPNAGPVITQTYQSLATASPGDTIALSIEAEDPEGQALSFSWSANTGTLGAPANTAESSSLSWVAPVEGCSHTVTVTVADPGGATSSHNFQVDLCLP